MVVAGNLVVLRCVCEIIFRHEEDAKELKTALIEAIQMINGLKGMIVLRYFVLLVFALGGQKKETILRCEVAILNTLRRVLMS